MDSEEIVNELTNEIRLEFEYLREIRKEAQAIYDKIDNSENFKFTMSHIVAVFEAIGNANDRRNIKI